MRGCLRFVFEPLEMPVVEGRGEWQDLEGDAPAEGNLLRFVNNTHAAAADLAQNAKVAQKLRHWRRVDARSRLHRSVNELEPFERLPERFGQLHMTGQILCAVGLPAGFQLG